MNLFFCQLKGLILKNYKTRKAGHLKLSIAFQLFLHFIFIFFLVFKIQQPTIILAKELLIIMKLHLLMIFI